MQYALDPKWLVIREPDQRLGIQAFDRRLEVFSLERFSPER